MDSFEWNAQFADLMRKVPKKKAEKPRKSFKLVLADLLHQPDMHSILKSTYITYVLFLLDAN